MNPEQPTPTPHDVPWWHRLLNLNKRNEHPAPHDPEKAQGGEENATERAKREQAWRKSFQLSADRAERYRIFDDMDYGSAAAVADLVAEEATQQDYDKRLTVWVEAGDKDTSDSVNACLGNLMVEDNATSITRAMCVKGDHFRKLGYAPKSGVFGWQARNAADIDRVEDNLGRLVGFKEKGQKFRGAMSRDVSWPWDYVHFRLPGKYDETGYGTSIYDTMFLPWRQLTLAEDSKLIYMIRRAPDRNAVMVDVGDLDDDEAMEYVNRWRKSIRKQEIIDPASPGYRNQFNPLTPFEDMFIPVRGGDQTSRIETLAGSGAADQVYDLNYFRDKFYGSSRVPKAYMGIGDQAGGDSGKATLVRQDVKFARQVQRVQRAYLQGLRNVCDIHLVLKGADPAKMPKYTLQMSPISYLAELERLEVVRMRVELLEAMGNLANTLQLDTKAWATYILAEYGRLPDALVQKITARAAAPPGNAGQEGKAEGAYPLSKEEKRMIHEAMIGNPRLRHAAGTIAATYHESFRNDPAYIQSDPTLFDSSEATGEAAARGEKWKELNEDMAKLTPLKAEAVNG